MFLQANVVHKVNSDLTTGASLVEGVISLSVRRKQVSMAKMSEWVRRRMCLHSNIPVI